MTTAFNEYPFASFKQQQAYEPRYFYVDTVPDGVLFEEYRGILEMQDEPEDE